MAMKRKVTGTDGNQAARRPTAAVAATVSGLRPPRGRRIATFRVEIAATASARRTAALAEEPNVYNAQAPMLAVGGLSAELRARPPLKKTGSTIQEKARP
jgi:hypothetical protein